MAKTTANIKSTRFCAFCKFWWDPCCKYIAPHIGSQWYYEAAVKCRCIKRNIDTAGYSTCAEFKLKIEL